MTKHSIEQLEQTLHSLTHSSTPPMYSSYFFFITQHHCSCDIYTTTIFSCHSCVFFEFSFEKKRLIHQHLNLYFFSLDSTLIQSDLCTNIPPTTNVKERFWSYRLISFFRCLAFFLTPLHPSLIFFKQEFRFILRMYIQISAYLVDLVILSVYRYIYS